MIRYFVLQSKSHSLFVFLQAYKGLETPTQPLVAYVTLYQGRAKAFESQPIEVNAQANTGVQGDIAKLTDLDRLYESVATKGRIDVVIAKTISASPCRYSDSLKS
jgi:hypothetical protein